MPRLSPGERGVSPDQMASYTSHPFPEAYKLEHLSASESTGGAYVYFVFSNGETLNMRFDDLRPRRKWELPFRHAPEYAVGWIVHEMPEEEADEEAE